MREVGFSLRERPAEHCASTLCLLSLLLERREARITYSCHTLSPCGFPRFESPFLLTHKNFPNRKTDFLSNALNG
jgi:hypothetical protein